jgi:hypothetical protein
MPSQHQDFTEDQRFDPFKHALLLEQWTMGLDEVTEVLE